MTKITSLACTILLLAPLAALQAPSLIAKFPRFELDSSRSYANLDFGSQFTVFGSFLLHNTRLRQARLQRAAV